MACVYCSNLPFNYPKRVATIANFDGQLALQTQTPTPKLSSPQRSTRERGRRRRLNVDESHQEIELFSASREFRLVWCVCHSAFALYYYITHILKKWTQKKTVGWERKRFSFFLFPPESCLVEGLTKELSRALLKNASTHTHTVEINLKRYCINNGWWDKPQRGKKTVQDAPDFFLWRTSMTFLSHFLDLRLKIAIYTHTQANGTRFSWNQRSCCCRSFVDLDASEPTNFLSSSRVVQSIASGCRGCVFALCWCCGECAAGGTELDLDGWTELSGICVNIYTFCV